MRNFFSKRHQDALIEKKLHVSFPIECRRSMERILRKYSDWGGWDNVDNLTFEGATEDLLTFYGQDKLRAFDKSDKRVPASISQVIISDYPAHVLDVIEAWFYQNPKQSRECEKELNDILTINQSSWRIVNGEAMLVDSDYLHQEVRAKTIHLLKECKAAGALEEYQDAINDLTNGETKDAVVKAHKSVESVMKTVLETKEHLRYGQLLTRLVKSDIIPQYYEDFLKHFEQLALGAVKERNLPARGHGQGRETTIVPHCLAEFTVNLAGTINVFIIKHWIEIQKVQVDEKDLDISDIPL